MTTSDRLRGFTLLEMLVVMLIAGMALALTSQALSQYKRAHERVSASMQGGREYRLSERWFHDSVAGLHAGGELKSPSARRLPGMTSDTRATLVFQGNEHGFSGLTLLPVLAGQGIPTMQTWSLTNNAPGDGALTLDEDGKQLVLRFPDAGLLTLHYVDAAGELHAQWPPAQGQWPELPAAIALELDSGSMIMAAVVGPQDPMAIPYEHDPI
ncbi:type II secretion system protein [Stenotrophomonas sp. PS02297]|uniref:prepilin-type N-terminal cleavage/methylation domain-containing protein n=1 Tax=Stenotrophomonas sp. PS02297 TaxID=2991423 RepID=UPI002499C949|nr:type II secretion system protein [Stenotrophomonas sp. PS02297]